MEKEDKDEQDTFFNQLRSASTKRRVQEFLKKDIHDQIQDLEYSLGRNKDRIKELGFERERIKISINSMLGPSRYDRYGIEARKELILAHERIINKKRKKKEVNKNRKRSFLVLLSRRLVNKREEKKRKFFESCLKISPERVNPIKLSSRLKDIDPEINEFRKKVQILKEEIQMRKEMIFDNKEYDRYQNEKPKYTPSILYDKEPPPIADMKNKTRKQDRKKKKFSEATLKICILGEQGVGISTWFPNFSAFNILDVESYKLKNYGFGVKSIKLEDKTFKLQIWFLNAHRLFKKRYCRDLKMFELLIRGCNGAILVYDITNIKFLSRIPEWIHSIRETSGDIPILLLGNKCDLESLREISKEQGIDLVKKYNLSGSYEISVKTAKNVDLPFQKISVFWLQKYFESEKEYEK